MKHAILPLLSITLFVTNVSGQKDSTGIKTSTDKFIRINYENDYFTQTDIYYTQGIKLESVNPAFRYSPVMWLIPRLGNSTVKYGISAVQDCFTPTNIGIDTIQRGDRPYAGYVYLGHYKTSTNYYKKKLLTSEIDIGEIGNCSECEAEQKEIHKYGDNTQPEGWNYQIGTGLMLNYKLRYEKALYADTAIDIDAVGQANAGTVYDNALAGLTLHLGKMQSYFIGNRTTAFQLYGIVQVWVEGVGYNATLQGDLFTHNSVYTLLPKEITPYVFGDSYGICLSWHKTSIQYYVTHITNELETGVYHGWGHIDITKYF
ncbi:MAG TPA: lipid A deacylase LpxR family protein [Bacteroidia bacterium]|jgi:lipid A 3-O-deacylase|nr:lipid A deacylase LpxR family protein [Bacteroidia bacterium]